MGQIAALSALGLDEFLDNPRLFRKKVAELRVRRDSSKEETPEVIVKQEEKDPRTYLNGTFAEDFDSNDPKYDRIGRNNQFR